MKVVYSPLHQQHDPEREFSREGLVPYPECAARAENILAALRQAQWAEIISPGDCSLAPMGAVHDSGYLRFLEQVHPAWVKAGEASPVIVAATFALRGQGTCPPEIHNQAGYYGFDTTPIVQGTWPAAREAARCALRGAELILSGEVSAYALCRPPGHHAGRDHYGGYCYLNNAALAAAHLSAQGKVAILDIDYHHGNGTQDIFYASDQVLFASLHADPARQYPLFWGYAHERGESAGEGCNHNFPLPPGVDDCAYLEVLDQALDLIASFSPRYLVVSAGLDIYGEDPLGDFAISPEGFSRIGERIASLHLPTLLVQEGGYHLERLGELAVGLLGAFA
jgi:acetoin utilization deacetylase AcuC-like enzyme